jgi:hypothetical protein
MPAGRAYGSDGCSRGHRDNGPQIVGSHQMDTTPWPPALRYRFYRAWNIQMFGLAVAALAPALQFIQALALISFFSGAAILFCGAIMSRSALREAGRPSRWRNFTPRLEDWPPLAVRRFDPDQADLRRWADASTAAAIVAIAIGYAATTLLS